MKHKLKFFYKNNKSNNNNNNNNIRYNNGKNNNSNKATNNNDIIVEIINIENGSVNEFSNDSVNLYYAKQQKAYYKEDPSLNYEIDDCSSINDITNYYNKMKIEDRNYYVDKNNNKNMVYNEQKFKPSEFSNRGDNSYKYCINNNNVVYNNNYGINNLNNSMDNNVNNRSIQIQAVPISPKNITNENTNINRNYIININENNAIPNPAKPYLHGYSRSLEDSFIFSNSVNDYENNRRHARFYSANNNKISTLKKNLRNQVNNIVIASSNNYDNNNFNPNFNSNFNNQYPLSNNGGITMGENIFKSAKYQKCPVETTDITVYSKYTRNNISPSLPANENIYYNVQNNIRDYNELDYDNRRRHEKCIIA